MRKLIGTFIVSSFVESIRLFKGKNPTDKIRSCSSMTTRSHSRQTSLKWFSWTSNKRSFLRSPFSWDLMLTDFYFFSFICIVALFLTWVNSPKCPWANFSSRNFLLAKRHTLFYGRMGENREQWLRIYNIITHCQRNEKIKHFLSSKKDRGNLLIDHILLYSLCVFQIYNYAQSKKFRSRINTSG